MIVPVEIIQKQVQLLSQDCGVYIFRDATERVLYVGKAKHLKTRLLQYVQGHDGRPMVDRLLKKAVKIDITLTQTEKEALIVEATLIKKYQPPFNVRLKSGGQYMYVMIDHRHDFPKVDLVRRVERLYSNSKKRRRNKKKNRQEQKYISEEEIQNNKSTLRLLGPFPSSQNIRRTLEFIHRKFSLRTCSDAELQKQNRPCLEYQMKRCLAPCVNYCTKEEYAVQVEQVVFFLQGKNQDVIDGATKRMMQLAEQERFEEAAIQRDLIISLRESIQQQNASEQNVDRDVWGWYRSGSGGYVALIPFRRGKMQEVIVFPFFETIEESDEQLLSSLLNTWYEEGDLFPKEILLPLVPINLELLEESFCERANQKVYIVIPKIGKKMKLIQLATHNAQNAYERKHSEEERVKNILTSLQSIGQLKKYPSRIECFDNSNIQGSNPVASMVTYVDGKKAKSLYRKFQIKTVKGPDDYASMTEVLERRFLRSLDEEQVSKGWGRPDLLVVDGGRGQLQMALNILEALKIEDVDVIGFSKPRTEHARGELDASDKIVLEHVKEPIRLPKNNPVLLFLQQIRDETHNTAVAYHQKRRRKSTLTSALDSISGVGPKKKKDLIEHFGSIKSLREASVEELLQVSGIGPDLAQIIYETFHSTSEMRK